MHAGFKQEIYTFIAKTVKFVFLGLNILNVYSLF